MPDYSTPPAQCIKPLLPAWLFSVAMHLAILALMYVAIQPFPRGVGDAQRGSMGIVLNSTSAEGTLNDGKQYEIQQAAAFSDDPVPPNLFAVAETGTNDSASAEGGGQSKTQKPSTGAKKSAAKQSKPGEKKDSRPTTSGTRLGSPGGSGYAQVSVFGVQGKGNKFIYVFDRSSSMEGAPLAAAKKQLLDSLKSLDSIHQFHIMFFNTKTQSFDISGGGRRIAFASDRNKKLAANFVGGITADGGTDRMVALREAITFSPDVIFFLSDADDPMSASEMAEIARANRKAQAAICVIEFGKKPAPVPNNFLARLAQESGGQYGYVNTTTLRK